MQNEIHFLQEEPNVKDYLLKQAAIAIKTIENNNNKTTTTTTTKNKDICDTQQVTVVDHIKNDAKKLMVTNFNIIFQKTQNKETMVSLMSVATM